LNSLEEKITAHYGTIYLISFTKSSLRSSAMRVKFSQTYKKNNVFIWGRLFSSSSLTSNQYFIWNLVYNLLMLITFNSI